VPGPCAGSAADITPERERSPRAPVTRCVPCQNPVLPHARTVTRGPDRRRILFSDDPLTPSVNHMPSPDLNFDGTGEGDAGDHTYPGPKFPYTAHPRNTLSGPPRSKPAPAHTTAKLSPGGGFLLDL
jgi:hypothetical protein